MCLHRQTDRTKNTPLKLPKALELGDLTLLVLSLIIRLLGPYLVLILPKCFSAYRVHKAHRLQGPRGPNQGQSRWREKQSSFSHLADHGQQRNHKNAVRFEVSPTSPSFCSAPEFELLRNYHLGLFPRMKIQREAEAAPLRV